MPVMIQVRNVPDDVAAELKSRAARKRQSLSDYLLDRLVEIAEQPTLDEVIARLNSRPRRHLGVTAAELLAEERAEAEEP